MQANLTHSQRRQHATKSGPGRRHKDGTYRNGKAKKTNFAAALQAHWAKKRAGSKAHIGKNLAICDKHGAVTLTGSVCRFENCEPGASWYDLGGSAGPDGFTRIARRIWLGGISAQWGF
jgi:hypothetical protein